MSVLSVLIASASMATAQPVMVTVPFWEDPPKIIRASAKKVVKRKKGAHRHKPKPVDDYKPGPMAAAPRCHSTFRAVGDQAASFDGAKDAAGKAWAQQARFSFGERYADLSNAEDLTFECVQSGTGALTGGLFNRCEMSAKPCGAPKLGTQNP